MRYANWPRSTRICHAQAYLAGIRQEIADSENILVNRVGMEHLIEANQQLVLAMLSVQSNAAKPTVTDAPSLYPALCKTNEELVISVLKAQNLQAKAELETAHQKSALIMVTDELRNLLTPISMITERLVKVPSEELPLMQGLMQDQVQHMAQLIEDLLDVSRVSTGKLPS